MKVFESPSQLNHESHILYFHSNYLKTQHYQQLLIFEAKHFLVIFSIQDKIAISLSAAPIGSVYSFCAYKADSLRHFLDKIFSYLHNAGIKEVYLHPPPNFYKGFVPSSAIAPHLSKVAYQNTNHHIKLDAIRSMHPMEQRKLEKLHDDSFVFGESDDIRSIYDFITTCREEKGLKINISFSKLSSLAHHFSDAYRFFYISYKNEITSACITVSVNRHIVYYYLPATSQKFSQHSPMVMLVEKMTNYFSKKQFKYFDLGISSIEGHTQKGLVLFKDHIGGVQTKREVFKLSL